MFCGPLNWRTYVGPFLQVPSSQGHATSQILLSEPVVPPGGVRLAGTATGVRFRDGFLRLLPCLYSLE